jgi:hypothetical protein
MKVSIRAKIVLSVGIVLSSCLPMLGQPSVASAAPDPRAKCLVITTPIREISGFRRTKQRCVRNTISGNKFVFVSKKEIPGTDLANGSLGATARLFQNMNRSLVKSWTWTSPGLGKGVRVTSDTLETSLKDCVDVFTGCTLNASRLDFKNQRVSGATVTVELLEGDCISEPYCGGWYSSMYRLKLTVEANEDFWE